MKYRINKTFCKIIIKLKTNCKTNIKALRYSQKRNRININPTKLNQINLFIISKHQYENAYYLTKRKKERERKRIILRKQKYKTLYIKYNYIYETENL